MVFSDLESHLSTIGVSTESLDAGGRSYLVIKGVRIPDGGSHAGQVCDVALFRSADNPWLPEAKLHVRPHLVPMGQKSSQASEVGPDWQYLSRRFDKPPSPKTFYAHILTALSEL